MQDPLSEELKSISQSQLKEIIKKVEPEMFDKMIIGENLLRRDYFLTHFKCEYIDRSLFDVRSPVYTELKSEIETLKTNSPLIENKVRWETYSILSKVTSNHSSEIETSIDDARLFFPLEVSNGKFDEVQQPFYLLDSVNIHGCPVCHQNKYVTCIMPDCEGKHEWTCPKCAGSGTTTCTSCSGEGWNKCYSCSGSGKKKERVKTASGSYSEKLVNCSKCQGKGRTVCTSCGRSGKVTCSKCSGNKKIVCSHCYGDKERYGLVDCSTCKAQGDLIKMSYVTSEISDNDLKRITSQGNAIKLEEGELEPYFSKISELKSTYSNVNGEINSDYDKYSTEYSEKLLKELGLHKESAFPMLLSEEIGHTVVPCVEFTYKHVLTGEESEGVLIDIWSDSPTVKFYTDSEKFKQSVGNIGKATKGFFTKMFKTKSYLGKVDKKIEMKLLIYLAKADGKIDESEKLFLAEEINGLSEFTNSEKKELIDLMDMASLPNLTNEDVKFSDAGIGRDVLKKLEDLASADGEMDESETQLIDHIKSIIG